MQVEIAPIATPDIPAVAQFMHAQLNSRVAPAEWARALQVPWANSAPNHGYYLHEAGEVVGAYLAYYSDREVDGRLQSFCNLGAWCVLETHRAQGLRLLTALLRQKDFHFTDFSPSGNVVPLNRKLKFTELDTTARLLPNIPWASRGTRTRVSSSRELLETALTGVDRQIYLDHREAAAAHHLLVTSGGRHCYVIFRKDTRKGIRAFASILHVGDAELFQRSIRAIGSHLLLKHGAAATLMEERVVGGRPRGTVRLSQTRPKMFKSSTLSEDQIDYLYSELVSLRW